MDRSDLRTTIYNSILELATEDGINASGKDEVYGCIFGRDSFITILKLIKVYKNQSASKEIDRLALKNICKNALNTLISLQGTQVNLESGEEPGKFIHEYRKDKYERLVNRPRPWFVYPDKILRNFDSIDSTPLGLIAIYKFWEMSGDNEFLIKSLPAVEKALNWIMQYGDIDNDYLLEYELSTKRQHGGLVVQSWTDSRESLMQKDGSFPDYPIAPVEVQGYAWLALKLWENFYSNSEINYPTRTKFAKKLAHFSKNMKKTFNKKFIANSDGVFFPVQALDGHKNQIMTVTGNPLLLLYSAYFNNDKAESIIDDKYIPDLVRRSFLSDMFDESAGIRTMSSLSSTYNPGQNSYHNGSFWPKLNGLSHEGLLNFGYRTEAKQLKTATIKPIEYFGTAIELYTIDENGRYLPFLTSWGKTSCRQQAWSAAVALDLLTIEERS